MSKTSKIVTMSFDCYGLDCGHPGDKRRIVGKPFQKGDLVRCPACGDIDSAYQAGRNDMSNTEAVMLKAREQ